MRKLAICYPGDMQMVFMTCVESLLSIRIPDGCEAKWLRGLGWCQARRRNHAAEQAVEWGADLIACLDLDQVYEPDILERLLARHDAGCDVIAAMVPMRGFVAASNEKPFQLLGWKINGKGFESVNPADGELQEADFPTSAAVLFRSSDLLKLRKPWYYFAFRPDDWKQIYGEDASFFLRMKREAGVTCWIDTTIRVKHAHVFEIDETYSDRFSDWKDPETGDKRICNYE